MRDGRLTLLYGVLRKLLESLGVGGIFDQFQDAVYSRMGHDFLLVGKGRPSVHDSRSSNNHLTTIGRSLAVSSDGEPCKPRLRRAHTRRFSGMRGFPHIDYRSETASAREVYSGRKALENMVTAIPGGKKNIWWAWHQELPEPYWGQEFAARVILNSPTGSVKDHSEVQDLARKFVKMAAEVDRLLTMG